jgi:hypothetical protein
MKKTKEKQITSYEKLVRICETFGARYNPGKEEITPIALSSLLEQAQQSVEAVTVARQAYISAISARAEAYEGIQKLATRVFHAMAASDATEKSLEDAMQIRNRFRYREPLKKVKPSTASTQESAARTGNLSVQLNFEAQASNFKRLVECAKDVPGYNTTEPDLSVDALESFHHRLICLNKKVIDLQMKTTQARFNRDAVLFSTNGISGKAAKVKHYFRTSFKHDSDEFRAVNGIIFMKK